MTHTSYESFSVDEDVKVFKEGEEAQFVFLVESGHLVTVKENNGRLVPTGIHKKGDFVGVSGGISSGIYDESCISVEQTSLIPLPISEISNVIDSNELWLKQIVNTIISRLDSAIDIMAEHKIFDTSKASNFEYTNEVESKLQKLLNE